MFNLLTDEDKLKFVHFRVNQIVDKYKEFDNSFENDLFNEISLKTCVEKRISAGGTGEKSVDRQIEYLTEFLND